LQRAGYQVLQAATGAEALRIVTELRPELVLLDVKCRISTAWRSAPDQERAIERRHHGLQVSASRVAPADRVQAWRSVQTAYLTEPLDPAELLATTRALLRLYDREKENRRLLVELRESEERMRI